MFRTALIAAAATMVISVGASSQPVRHWNGNGYGQNWGAERGLERRIDNVLESLDGARPDRRYQLRAEAISLDRQLHYASRGGLDPYEAHAFDVRIGQLERHLQWAAINRGGYYDRGGNGRWRRDRYND